MDLNKFFDDFNKKAGYAPKVQKPTKNLAPKAITEKKQVQPIQEKQTPKKPKKVESGEINEEFIEKSLKYTSVVLKSIRETFEGDQRHVIYESLYNTLGQLLGQQSSPVEHREPIRQESVMFPNTPKLSEEAEEEVAIVESNNKGYTRDMGIQATEKGVDLSEVSAQDISDFKALAGM